MAKKGQLKTTAEVLKGSIDPAHAAKVEPCPKCGGTAGWSGPLYKPAELVVGVDRSHPSKIRRKTVTIGEHLAWACSICGFTRTAPTKDNTK